MDTPFIIVIAGPNGVGKSTFAKWYLEQHPTCVGIVDPDAIARELNIDNVGERNVAAGRIALATIESYIEQGVSFAIESTLSGKTLATKLTEASIHGYKIVICLLQIPSLDVSAKRVAKRVATGGHNIPHADQRRRFERTYRNFTDKYIEVCHEWNIYDAQFNPPRILSAGSGGFSSGSVTLG